jgi:hypothetical protein
MLDNAFTHIDDWETAQKLADESDSAAAARKGRPLRAPVLPRDRIPRRRLPVETSPRSSTRPISCFVVVQRALANATTRAYAGAREWATCVEGHGALSPSLCGSWRRLGPPWPAEPIRPSS